MSWTSEGRVYRQRHAEHPLDIVRNLGPYETKHDDGTTTRLCMVAVTMPDAAWETNRVVGFRQVATDEKYLRSDDQVSTWAAWTSSQGMYPILEPLEPLTPEPDENTLILARAIAAGEVDIPVRAIRITRENGCLYVWTSHTRFCYRSQLNGTLPHFVGADYEIPIDEARELAKTL